MGSEIVNLDLLKKTEIIVKTLTVENIPAVHKFSDQVLSYEKDCELSFYIPNKIASISVEVSGKIDNGNGEGEEETI